MQNEIVTTKKRTKGARLAPKERRDGREATGFTAGEGMPAPRREKKRMGRVVPAVILAVSLAVVGALTYALAFYDKIYPNVSVGGVGLGGLTMEEAADKLEEALQDILNERYAGATFTLSVAGEETVLALEQAGLLLKAEGEPVRLAWAHGHEGGFFARVGVVASSLFAKKDFPLNEGNIYIDEKVVEETVTRIAEQTDVTVVANQIEKLDDEILVTVGSGGRVVDREALAALIVDRLTRGDFSTVTYEPNATKPLPVDLNTLYDLYCFPAKNARLNTDDPENMNVLPEEDGLAFDQEAAQAALDAAAPGDVVRIPLAVVPAEISAATLQSKLFADELATFTTYLNSGNKPRTNNIRLSASFINETILLPGGEFSFNGVVGQRTTARGFQMAGAYLNGRLIDEVGGGICQMATTVYNTAVRANLAITDRSCHSMTVGYVPLGHDATVNWGTTDLKFKNDTDYPVKILASQSGGAVTVTVMGTKVNDYTVTFEHRTLSSTPFETKTVNNPSLAPGARKVTTEGHNGATAESYRVIKDKNGNVISRTLEAKSSYRKVDQVVEVGPAAESTPTPATTTPTPATTTPEPSTSTPVPVTPEPDPTPDATETDPGADPDAADPGDVWE